MLKRLFIKNLTVFAEADFEFGPGLNVVVGTNGTGKSHVLKLGYAVEFVRKQVKTDDFSKYPPEIQSPPNRWSTRLFRELPSIFQTADLKYFVSTKTTGEKAIVEAEFDTNYQQNDYVRFEIGIANTIQTTGGGDNPGNAPAVVSPVMIPAKEVLTLSWMLPASDQLVLPIEGNYLHLLSQLRGLPRRQPAASGAIATLTAVLGGEIKEEGDKYYLVQSDGKRTEANMLAEGLRKFGILQKLLSNGSLTSQTTLFWDEPEANQNPALLQKIAAVLAELARLDFQIILATHSLFLLKELHILSQQKDTKPLPVRYFGLNSDEDGATAVTTVDSFDELPDIVALDVQLEQNELFLDVLNESDANV